MPASGRRFAAAATVLGGLIAFSACNRQAGFRGQPVDEPYQPALTGTNWNGEAFDLSALPQKVKIVTFGYTFCPDVCPFSLSKLRQLYQSLGDRADEVAVVFASVDPRRDSVEKLSQYVPNFEKRFYGLHLDSDQLEQAEQAFHLTIQYGQPKDGPGTDSFYYVDHTASFFILDGNGTVRVTFPTNAPVEEIEADVRTLLE